MAAIDDTGLAGYTSDIHVRFLIRGSMLIFGTWQQLQQEGFVPSSEPMPKGLKAHWRANACADVWVDRQWVPGSRKRGVKLLESDWWRLRIDHDDWTWDRKQLYEREEALRQELYRQSAEGRREFDRRLRKAWAAQEDAAFQQFKQQLLPQRKGATA